MANNQTTFLNALAFANTAGAFEEAWSQSDVDKSMLNQTLGSTEKFQINQALEKRGGLRFNYAPTNLSPDTKRVWIPFFENPTISESRKANYASTKIFLRNEPVRLYTGSEARKFKVDIHYSLIHMAAMVGSQDLTELFSVPSKSEDLYQDAMAIATYLQNVVARDTNSDSTGKSDATLVKELVDRATVADGPFGPNRWWKDTPGESRQGSNYWNFALLWMMRTRPQWVRHHQLVQKVINNIRGSVIGTQQMPVKGPTIVELKWGATYDFTPCIITDYKLQPVEAAGYDAKSLTAQRLKVSVSLEEMRNINGNLWGNPEIGGNLPGWDSIQQLGTIDPKAPDTPRTLEESYQKTGRNSN